MATRWRQSRWSSESFGADRLNLHHRDEQADDLVLLVHGLGGSGKADGTWRDIPSALFDRSKNPLDVAIFDYPTVQRRWLNPAADLNFYTIQLADHLGELIDEYSSITLVGHSMGGLMIKSAVARYARQRGLEGELLKVPMPTIVFIASPLAGAPLASAVLPPFDRDTRILKVLSDWVADHNAFFTDYTRPLNVARTIEEMPLVLPQFAIAGGADNYVPIQSALAGIPSAQQLRLVATHTGILGEPAVPLFIEDSVLRRKQIVRQERSNFLHSHAATPLGKSSALVCKFLSDRSDHEWERRYRVVLAAQSDTRAIENRADGQAGGFDALVVVLDLSDPEWMTSFSAACDVARSPEGAGCLTGFIGVGASGVEIKREIYREARSRLGELGRYYAFLGSNLDEITEHMNAIIELAAETSPADRSGNSEISRPQLGNAAASREY